MRSISQRELRNENARIVREDELGETYTVTRRGVPVARIGPVVDDVDLRCVKPASRRLDPGALRRIVADTPTRDVIDGIRSDR
jgi:antitoxin (DNA-binding transcriptional repressor) of toxin-antitoxin stability system